MGQPKSHAVALPECKALCTAKTGCVGVQFSTDGPQCILCTTPPESFGDGASEEGSIYDVYLKIMGQCSSLQHAIWRSSAAELPRVPVSCRSS